MNTDKQILLNKRKVLLNAIGKVVKEQRNKIGKGINILSFEYDIGNGLISRLEHGVTDTQISTLWKIANALGMKMSDLINQIEEELPKDFNFYDE